MDRLTIDEVIHHCIRTCEKTEQVAIDSGLNQDDITSRNYWEHFYVKKWLEELKRYREAEEQGLLIKLPCKVGDKVYIPGHQFPSEIWEISINGDGIFANYVEYEYSPELTELWDDGDFAIKDIGKYVFLTREEAERALRERGPFW